MRYLPSSLLSLTVRSRILPLLGAAAGITALVALPAPSAAGQSCASPALGRVLDSGVDGPDLWTESGPPVVGRSFSLRVSNGVPGATGVLGWSFHHDPRPVPFASGLVHPGLPLALDPIVLDEHGNSPALLQSPPLALGVCGVEIYVQAALVGSGPSGGVTLTNALHLGVGGPNAAPFRDPKIALPQGDLVPFDMNGDGLTDLVARQLYYPDMYTELQQFLVLLNLGDGTFSPGPITRTDVWRSEFLVADFDGDGFGDVVTAGILLTGDAEPRLTVRGTTFTPGYVEPRALGDLNADGMLDVVGLSSSGLVTSLNQGGGIFVPGPTFPISVGRVALGHFDFDPTLDAAVAHSSAPDVAVLFGNGDASFQSGPSFVTAARVAALSAHDLDGDGLDDLIYGMASGLELHVQRCVGGGVFDLPVPYPMNDPVTRLVVLDLDGDGHDDLVANHDSVLLGRGDGTFEPPAHYGVWMRTNASLLDVDHDGRMDVVAGDGTLHRGLAGGRLNAPRRPVAGLSAGEDIAVGDLDGDGLDDLVVPDREAEVVLVVRALERGLFAAPQSVAAGWGPNRVALGDLDGDGVLDAAVGHFGDGALLILRGDGAGALEVGASHPLGATVSELALADLDADGQLDVIASHLAVDAGFSVALGNGDGTFQPSLTRVVRGESRAVVVGHFLGSASVDVLVLRDLNGNHALMSYAGNGDGTFGTAVSTFTSHDGSFVVPRHMTAADGDLDGDPDLFLSAYDGVSQYQLFWRTNANGTFTRRSRRLDGVRQHAVADFSGDGLPDFVATSHGSTYGFNHGLHFFAGNGTMDLPATGLPQPLGFRGGPLAIGDFDRNGTPDVAVVNEGSRDVWVTLNHLGE